MFNTHRFIAGFLSLVMLVTWPSLAYGQTISEPEEEMTDGDYTTVKKGDRVPYDGYLFEPAGVIKIMVNKSLELEPNNDFVYLQRGYAKNEIKDYEGAIQDYSIAIEFNDENLEAYFFRASAKSDLNNHKGAIEDYNFAEKYLTIQILD